MTCPPGCWDTHWPHTLGKMPGAHQPLLLTDLFPKMMDTHVSISSHQCSRLLVEAEQGWCCRVASLTPAGVFVEEKELAAPRAAGVQVQGPRQSITHIPGCSWGRGLVSPSCCCVTPTLTFFGQHARVCKYRGHRQVHLFIILAERLRQISV